MADSSPKVRVAIADDHPLFRAGLKQLLDGEPWLSIVGECADGLAAARLVQDVCPDVLLLDLAMPRLGGLEVLSTLGVGQTRVVLLTASIEPAEILKALQLGARGVVLKESAPSQLIDGIRRVMDGKYLIGTDIADDLVHAVQRAAPPRSRSSLLTARELEIVSAIVAGESNRDIANRLSLSLQTVKHHLTSIFDKTGVSTRLELALYAIHKNIHTPV